MGPAPAPARRPSRPRIGWSRERAAIRLSPSSHHRQSMAESQASAGTAQAADANHGGSSEDHARASVLFIGGVVGGRGRRTLPESLPLLRERYGPTFLTR